MKMIIVALRRKDANFVGVVIVLVSKIVFVPDFFNLPHFKTRGN